MKDFTETSDKSKKNGRKKAESPETEESIDSEMDESELHYEGIVHPDYRLKTVYVPYNAQGISKGTGYDPDTGESFTYTTVKLAHQVPGEDRHRMEEYRIRLDSRVVVPAFVAHALGDRADAQDYFG